MEKKKRGRPRKDISGFAPKPDLNANPKIVLEQIIEKQNTIIAEQHNELVRLKKDLECYDDLLANKTQDHEKAMIEVSHLNKEMSELCIAGNEQALKNSRQEQIISKLFEVINLINKKPE